MNDTNNLRAEVQSRSQSVYTITSERNVVAVKSKRSVYKKFRKKDLLLYTLAFIVALLAVAVVIISVFYAKFTPTETVDLCDNEDCLRIAASFKETMNTSIDPCDDFYEYVCGRWPQSHPYLDLSEENSWFMEKSSQISKRVRNLLMKRFNDSDIPWAVREAQTLFQSCMDVQSRDELGLEPLFDLLNDIGLPKIPSALTKNTTDFVKQLAMTKRILWADIFFGVYVAADPKNSSRNTLVLDLPNRQNPFPSEKILEKRLKKVRERARDMFVDEVDEESANFSSAEKIYMSEIMKQMISNGTTDEPSCKSRGPFMLVPEEEIDQTVDKLFDLSGQFYVISKSYQNKTEDMQDIGDDNYMLLDDLQLETDLYVKSVNESLEPKIVWKPFFEEFLKIIDEFDLETEKVLVTNLEYFKQISVILAETEDNLLETAIWWIVVDHCVPYSSKELRKIWHSYVNELTGSSERSWSTFCAENVNDLMGMAVAWLYVNPMFLKDGSSIQVYEMLKNIKTSFSKHVSNVDWMDRRTKQATMEKNRNMRSLIAYPKWLFEEIILNDYYRGMNMSTTRYFDNMVQIIRIVNYYELCSLTNKSDSNEPIWRVEPTEVNALHNFQENQIVIPFGILQFPFYGLGLEALNYGAIGTILGHELTHGFDNSGRKFDSKGNMKQWWSNETIMNYADKTTCFIDKYSAYYVPEIDEYIDGKLTLGENIADNGGLRQAYDAYQVWKSKHKPEALLPGFSDYTHEQLLFMSYAHMWCESFSTVALRWMLRDSHCPGHVRLKMVLRNSEHFSKAWNCSKGSPMNPVDKCHLW